MGDGIDDEPSCCSSLCCHCRHKADTGVSLEIVVGGAWWAKLAPNEVTEECKDTTAPLLLSITDRHDSISNNTPFQKNSHHSAEGRTPARHSTFKTMHWNQELVPIVNNTFAKYTILTSNWTLLESHCTLLSKLDGFEIS